MAIESVVGSIISKIAELMVEPVGRQFRYMFCFNHFVKEFKQQKEKLVSEKERQQDDVKAAERNAEEIYEDVEKWLVDAKNKIEGAKPLEIEIGKNGKCFTWCPNCMRQFKLSKALAKKSETFREHLEKKPTKVSHRAHPEPIEFLPSKEFTPSESSKEALEQIMKALKDDSVNMIGLYGMGGAGKTTLVQEVGRRAKESQPVYEVVMATVSQNPNVIDIQKQMADKLGLNIKEKSTHAGRADLLWQRLKKVEKMLIILDDVWNRIDLKMIGIPFGDDHRGCKILLTTRRRDICLYMVCQKNVFLGLFSEKEAWDLFRINAGLDDGDSTLNTLARKVASECHRLPIALVTVGKALRDKSEVEWEVAFTQLKKSQFVNMEHIEEKNAYACLKLSYDYLKSKETKLCFLLCCLFPEDYNIPIEDLTRYAVGYGLHQDGEPIGDAKKRVYVEIKKLKDCCMLLDNENDERVKMHDLVRDVAIQIASSKEYGFMVKASIGLKEWPFHDKSFEGCTTISLMGNKLAELPEGLVCPQLKVLLLEVDDGMTVPERFFEGMREIEVLSLKGGCLSLKSLELSTNLQSLVLIMCELKDLIWLRKLQRLRILGLMWSFSIEELPYEIGELKELRLLDVTGCPRLRRIPVNLIGRLKKLEELLIGDYSFDGCDSTGGMNASLTELNSLSQLAVLSLRIPKVECIPRDFVFPVSLRKYHIILGNGCVAGRYPTSTRLSLAGTSLNAKIFEQLFLHKLESVQVTDCGDVFTLFPARLRQGLKNLKEVFVHSCESLEEVFELGEADEGSSEEKELPLLSYLTELQLSELPQLKCIWKGPTRHVSLQNLARLDLWSLDKLTFIFTASLARSLPKLETLVISECGELKHIIREEDGEREIITESLCFPQLKKIEIYFCDKLEYLFLVSLSHNRDGIIKFPQLKELSLGLRSNYSFLGPRNFDAQLPLQRLTIKGHAEVSNWLTQLQQNGFLQSLEYVHLDECGDVRAPFPAKLLQALKNLKSVKIKDCKSLEEVFELGEADEGSNEEKELPPLSSLTELQLSKLPQLKCIWKGPTGHVSLQSLVFLELGSLNKLTFIFTPSLAQSLPKLERLEIRDCGELKHIIREEDGEREIIPESPRFPKLKKIFIQGCDKLEYVFPVPVSPSLPNLEEMKIGRADNLKQIFYSGEGDALPTDVIIKFPRLRELSLSNGSFFGPKNFAAQLPSLKSLTIYGHEGLGNLFAQLQGLTNLETLCLKSLRDMRCIWKGLVSKLTTFEMAAHGEQNGSLQRLECVPVNECGDVTTKFLQINLKALKKVIVDSCESLKEVFELGESDEGSSEEKELPLLSSLTKLQLSKLPELKCIWKGPTRHVSLQSLVFLKLSSLDKLTFIFTTSLAQSLPKLKGLEIRDCGELKHIIREEVGEREIIPESPRFPQLKDIFIQGCGKLEYVLPVSLSLTLQSLPKLETLDISECGELKHIIREEYGEREIIPESSCFPELKTLNISFCDKLEYVFPVSLSHNRDGIIKFPQLRKLSLQLRSNYSFLSPRTFDAQLPLQKLTIEGHEEVGNWLAQLQGLTNLETLYLKSLPDMRCIWKGLVLSKLTTLEQNGFLQRLESVHLDDCGDVRALFPAKLLQALKNLKSVEIKGCKSLEEVFELGEADEGSSEEKELSLLSSLTKLQLSKLPELKCIWKGPTGHVSLQNLARLDLWSLDKLTFIFTPPLAQSLPKLEGLYISDCGELKHIIREEDGEKEIIPESPCFPQLKTLSVFGCGKLEYVFPVSLSHNRDGIIKFPQLRELSLELRSNYSFLGPRNFDAQLPLQRLTIEGHEEVGNWLAQLQQIGFLQRLESVHLDDCGDVRAPFPAKLLQALKNPKRVEIKDCKSLEEVFELGEADEGSSEEKELPLLSSLTALQLSKLPKLKCIWKGPTRHVSLQSLVVLKLDSLDKLTFIFTTSLAQSLPKLERLSIRDCGELKHIIREEDGEGEVVPESPRFPKLKEIFIQGCGKLEYVFTVSVSPSLPNLEEMTIYDGDNLKQIFYSGEGDALTTDFIIKFPRLRELSLSNCSFFGPKNFAAQLPSLQILEINGRKELGNLSAQLQGLTNLETLSLKSLPDMRCIWKGLVLSKLTTLEQNDFLQRLESVYLDDCGDVRSPFPAKLLQALKNLKSVDIRGCKSLEEVFELGEADEGSSEEKEVLSSLTNLELQRLPKLKCIWKGPTGHVSLQSLIYLELNSLDKLTFIFTPSLARSLPKLKRLEISKCGQLKHIIREEDGEREIIPESPGQDDQVEKEIVLPNLKLLLLEQLSSIVCFSFGWCDYFLFPRLEKLKVHQCPKLTTEFASTPDGSMSAQSKVSEVAEDSSINREWTRYNGWKEDGAFCL